MLRKSQSPQTGQVYFNSGRFYTGRGCCKSQSPQTGQVYFNWLVSADPDIPSYCLSLNPLKRVKFISM